MVVKYSKNVTNNIVLYRLKQLFLFDKNIGVIFAIINILRYLNCREQNYENI